jgi:serine phosphatase RsbU (regulator of sigma subunit)
MKRRGVRREFNLTLSELEAFYLTDDDRRHLETMPAFNRFLHRTGWLIRSLLLKLSSRRRVILAAAILFVVLGVEQISLGNLRLSLEMHFVGALLLFALLMLELKDKLVARDELEAGRTVQLALLPKEMPDVPGWDVWLYTAPANDVGGDLVDHLQIDADHHGVALGDVAGKALPAALLSVKLQATLRALVPQFSTLSELGAAVNRILERDGLPSRFASLVWVVITANAGQLRLLNAGHMPPLVVRPTGVETMERGSVVLGIMPDATFFEQQVELAPGDAMVVYSDGVSEAMNEAGDFFGDDRLHATVRALTGRPARQIGQTVLDALKAFTGDAPRHDDVSLLVLVRQ